MSVVTKAIQPRHGPLLPQPFTPKETGLSGKKRSQQKLPTTFPPPPPPTHKHSLKTDVPLVFVFIHYHDR